MEMTPMQEKILKFLQNQKKIREYLAKLNEFEKEKNKEEMKKLIAEAEKEGFDLEFIVSEDEAEEETTQTETDSFDPNIE
jgi:uncharacterized protein (UPF0335 family)